MKKVTLMIAALALVLGTSQCRKGDKPMLSGESQYVVLNATFGDNGAKIAEDNQELLTWSEGDVLTVGGTGTGSLTCTNAETGTFEGTIKASEGNLTFTFGEENYFGQSGALNDAMCLSSGNVPYDEKGEYKVTMTIENAVLKLDLKALGTPDGNLVTITVGDDELVASVAGVTDDLNKFYYVAMPPAESREYTFSGNGLSANKTWEISPNTFYTLSGNGAPIVIEPGSGPGPDPEPEGAEFSIGGKTVVFAKGNLQATYQGNGNYSWSFAENQYDFIGNAPGNNNIGSHSVGDVVDLFCWSSDTEGNYYGLSGTNPSYYPINGVFKDWGEAYCSSNGLASNTWRTLSAAEWEWLLGPKNSSGVVAQPGTNCRTSSTVNGTANARYAFVKVNGIKGMMVFPDVFTWPSEVTDLPTRINGKTPKETVMPPVPPIIYEWNNVDYSLADFEKLEQAGVIFLPVTGYRQSNGTVIAAVNSTVQAGGYYSTSTSYPEGVGGLSVGCERNIGFSQGTYSCTNFNAQDMGFAVRLIHVVE